MKTIKDLQQMMSEPASKEWFKKHGMDSVTKKTIMNAKARALNNKKK